MHCSAVARDKHVLHPPCPTSCDASAARTALGVSTTGAVAVTPGLATAAGLVVYVQSTSPNRKLKPGQRVAVAATTPGAEQFFTVLAGGVGGVDAASPSVQQGVPLDDFGMPLLGAGVTAPRGYGTEALLVGGTRTYMVWVAQAGDTLPSLFRAHGYTYYDGGWPWMRVGHSHSTGVAQRLNTPNAPSVLVAHARRDTSTCARRDTPTCHSRTGDAYVETTKGAASGSDDLLWVPAKGMYELYVLVLASVCASWLCLRLCA